jgi:hypothetical protein
MYRMKRRYLLPSLILELVSCPQLRVPMNLSLYRANLSGTRIYRPSFRENKSKTHVFSHRKQAFWACFRENWVYKIGHGYPFSQNCPWVVEVDRRHYKKTHLLTKNALESKTALYNVPSNFLKNK